MWDYDKLFAEGNVIGIKVLSSNRFYNYIVDNRNINNNSFLSYYKNNNLRDKDDNDFEIQYIIRLDEHGNVVEKLFDRERDMPNPMPELETGMFVRVVDNGNMDYTVSGYVDIQNCRVIYQDGTYNDIVKLKKLTGMVDIVEIYSQKTNCFNQCLGNDTLIWRSPDYQAYLDSKN